MPGTYKVRMTFGGAKDSTQLTVKYDPRFEVSQSVLEERHQMQLGLYKMKGVTGKGMDRLRESNGLVLEYEKKLKDLKRDDLKNEMDQVKVVKDSLKNLMDLIVGEQKPEIQGWRSTRTTISGMINSAINYIGSSKEAVSVTDKRVYGVAEDETNLIIKRVNDFYDKTWPSFKGMIEKTSLTPFKSYDPLKLN